MDDMRILEWVQKHFAYFYGGSLAQIAASIATAGLTAIFVGDLKTPVACLKPVFEELTCILAGGGCQHLSAATMKTTKNRKKDLFVSFETEAAWMGHIPDDGIVKTEWVCLCTSSDGRLKSATVVGFYNETCVKFVAGRIRSPYEGNLVRWCVAEKRVDMYALNNLVMIGDKVASGVPYDDYLHMPEKLSMDRWREVLGLFVPQKVVRLAEHEIPVEEIMARFHAAGIFPETWLSRAVVFAVGDNFVCIMGWSKIAITGV